MTLDEGIQRLLDQCDREDQNPSHMRYLYTSEIRYLLGLGPAPGYEKLEQALKEEW